MNPIQAVSADEPNVVELSESPGRRLRVLRQSKGWEIERVATQLHLRPHLVEALEQDRFQDLPGPVFIMGYLRNYARLLGIDPETLIAAYRTANPSLEPRVALVGARGTAKAEVGGGHILVRLVSLGLLLAVIGLLTLWWQNRAGPLPEPSLGADAPGLPVLPPEDAVGEGLGLEGPEAADILAPPAASGAGSRALTLPALPDTAIEPTATATTSGTPPPELTDSPATASGPTATLAEPAEEPPLEPAAGATSPGVATAAPETPTAPQVPEVVMSFTGTSWIDVRDASGNVILTGEMRKGDRRVLKGEPPYSFVIGNAKAAAVTVGNAPLDLSTRGRGGVARFKLDPSRPE